MCTVIATGTVTTNASERLPPIAGHCIAGHCIVGHCIVDLFLEEKVGEDGLPQVARLLGVDHFGGFRLGLAFAFTSFLASFIDSFIAGTQTGTNGPSDRVLYR